jgi:hypothetical protein
MDFIAVILLSPEVSVLNPKLKPMYLSRIENTHRLASTPHKDLNKNTVPVRYFRVSKPQYVHYNYMVNFPNSLAEIEEYTQNTP